MSSMALVPALTLEDAVERYNDFSRFVKTVLKESLDYGVIPGTNKPTLFKPGSEKICALFGLVPIFTEVETVEDWTGKDHGGEPFFFYKIRCQLTRGGVVVADCIASCNSWETRYRYRSAGKSCPLCGKDAIIKGKLEYGGGYICFAKKGGCGTKFKDDDERIKSQTEGKVANAEIFDQVNTLVKQAEKRAMVGATLIGANASEFFTQDMEDIVVPGEWKEVPSDDKPKERPMAPAAAPQRNPAPETKEPEDDWQPPTEETEAPKVTDFTPWEENGIIYRKSASGLLVKFGSDWRPALDQAKLSASASKSISDLFKNSFELEGHLFKHFQVKTLAALNWQQVLALLNFKKKGILHPIYYSGAIAIDKATAALKEGAVGKHTSGHSQALIDLFDPKGVVPEKEMQDFLAEATKMPDPESLKVLVDAGLNLKDHADAMTNIANLVASGDYVLLDETGKISAGILELVDYARTSTH